MDDEKTLGFDGLVHFWNRLKEKFSTVPSLLGGTKIPTGADLNDYKTVGTYYSDTYKSTSNLVNCPTNNPFTMTVAYACGGSWYTSQEIVDFQEGVRYFRMGTGSGTWYNWQTSYSTAYKPSADGLSGTMTVAKGGTNATTAVDAAKNLSVPTLLNGTQIPANSNLNDYKTVGSYCCPSDGTASGLTNCPVKVSFNMKVFYAWGTSGFIAQEVTNGASGVRFYRWCNISSGSWSSWNRAVTESDLSAIYSRLSTLELQVSSLLDLTEELSMRVEELEAGGGGGNVTFTYSDGNSDHEFTVPAGTTWGQFISEGDYPMTDCDYGGHEMPMFMTYNDASGGDGDDRVCGYYDGVCASCQYVDMGEMKFVYYEDPDEGYVYVYADDDIRDGGYYWAGSEM